MSTIVRYLEGAQEALTPAESRMTPVNEIRERVEREQYEVDAAAVAHALVERLLAGRTAWRSPTAP